MNTSDKIEIKLVVEKLSHEGRGIATYNNKKTFIAGALPNETVTCKIQKNKSNLYEAQLIAVLNASKDRVTPSCDHFNVCGGCSLQHMTSSAQMQLKLTTLLDQLKHFGNVTPQAIIPSLQANELGYRRKARLGVRYVHKKEKLLIGFREKSSRYLADLQACAVLHPEVGLNLTKIATFIRSLACYCDIPQVEIAIGDDTVALIFRCMSELERNDILNMQEFAKSNKYEIYIQPNSPAQLQKIWPQDNKFFLTYSLPDENLEFLFHPLDFTQINLELNRLMIKQALDFLDLQRQDSVLDLFCGLGNFTLPIAKRARFVVGIEGSEEMVMRANTNAQHNQIENVNFYKADLFSTEKFDAVWCHQTYDKILLDPPRTGAQPILAYLKQFNARKIVYVSCNPATLARDAGEIVHQHGYHLSHVGVMNMFPHTSHIEAMAVFEK